MSTEHDRDGNHQSESQDPQPESREAPLPRDFEEQSRKRFAKLDPVEVTFEHFLEREQFEFRRQSSLALNAALVYRPARLGSPCGNGNLENSVDPSEWQGGYGSMTPGIGLPSINFGALTAGLYPGPESSGQAHQTWVAAGSDPIVGIATTAQGSAGAVRIGNAVNGYGCELLSKTFVVTPAVSSITFWYALVLQDPGHQPKSCQPFFWVRVTDASGNLVLNAFDFGNGSDTAVADSSNPFFQATNHPQHGPVVYKDWGCAQIDLSSQVGKQVTIEFVTGDCGYGGHWGYAYVDSFCGNCKGSPTGNLAYNCEASSHCGNGQLCFDYSLPQTKSATGSLTIRLDIYQNGALLTQLTSPALTSGTSYCFQFTPGSIPGINVALGGFDWTATGAFSLGSTPLGSIKVGSAPDGNLPGANNDYQIACRGCAEIRQEQDAQLAKRCGMRVNRLPRASCHCPGEVHASSDCRCDCTPVRWPDIKPCISVSWGDSPCDCLETDDVEVLCVAVCNCYSNVTFTNLTIGRVRVTDADGNPVPLLPDGTPSVRVIPSGPICFGDVGPCRGKNRPGCVSRELALYTRGAVGKNYRVSFEGVCFTVTHALQSDQCFTIKLCQD